MAHVLVHDVPASREGCGVLVGALLRTPASLRVRVAVRAAHQVLGDPPEQGGGEVAND